jgi:type I restriction enzyme S subunit
MNTIKQLIEKYCPEGVEYKKLEEISNITTGQQFNKRDMSPIGTYPVINGGIDASGYIEQFNEEKDTITISQGGASAGYVNWISTRFWLGAHCYSIKPNEEVVKRYLYHVLKNLENKIMQGKQGAGIPGLNRKVLFNLIIPVPPISVQREIVRILDNFTSLEAELEAELEARRKQYEYYRDQLLSFKHLTGGGSNEVEWKTLGEVAEIVGGRDYKQFNHGNIPVYGSGGIMTYIDTYAYDRPTVLLPRKGSISNVFYTDMPFWNVDTIFYTIIHNELLPKFFYYYMCNYHIERLNTSNAARPALTRTVLNNIPIPVPPLSVQRRIVSILDRFEFLVNDISSGLPAEIAARHQQYEYYRDQLLTFRRK